ncbi:hypothetical protein ASE48_08365 [Mycobacterium sp. Root265]|uniref:hypothetical protein n=1 Tax=Mycobacterium sp. Root265 TaxID=1736504 RepID=UPI00070C19A5|nr:hypothetical protein [Mycobacterium sp. Root265]KRD08570.1 hypothetical protein ASE48_08365 [Mycobacterium sp. Root265]
MIRPQKIVVPLLQAALPNVAITTWVPDIDYRDFPMINVRRIGGIRNPDAPRIHTLPVIEMSAYTNTGGLIAAENLYEEALDALFDARDNQTVTAAGYIQSLYETMGATQFSSLYQDSWRVQGLIRLGLRLPRST